MNIHFYSFCTTNWENALNRTKENALNSNFFKSVNVLTEKDLDKNYVDKFKKILNVDDQELLKIKGYGYYFFKPYIWKLAYENAEINDFCMYLDAGSILNIYNPNTSYNLINLCNEINNYEYKMTLDRNGVLNQYSNKYDILKYFSTENDETYLNKREFQTGFFLFQKTFNTNVYDKFIIEGYNFYTENFDKCISKLIEKNKFLINNSTSQAIYNNIIYKNKLEDKFYTYTYKSISDADIIFNQDLIYKDSSLFIDKKIIPINNFSNIYFTLRRK